MTYPKPYLQPQTLTVVVYRITSYTHKSIALKTTGIWSPSSKAMDTELEARVLDPLNLSLEPKTR